MAHHGNSKRQGFKQLMPQMQIPTRTAHQTFRIRSYGSSSHCAFHIHAHMMLALKLPNLQACGPMHFISPLRNPSTIPLLSARAVVGPTILLERQKDTAREESVQVALLQTHGEDGASLLMLR